MPFETHTHAKCTHTHTHRLFAGMSVLWFICVLPQTIKSYGNEPQQKRMSIKRQPVLCGV